MSPRSGLVVELRFEMGGRLIEGFVSPSVLHDGPGPLQPVHWYLQIDQGAAFMGPPYAVYFRGQESQAEEEMRRFLTDDRSAALRFGDHTV